jgi:hypothetical protein
LTVQCTSCYNCSIKNYSCLKKINFQAVKENLDRIILHENVRSIKSVVILDDKGVLLQNETFVFERIRQYHFLSIMLNDTTFNNGSIYKVYIHYVGNINETPLSRGMFRGFYHDSNNNVR